MARPTDPLLNNQWYLTRIGVDALGYQYTGRGISTGIYDDGIQITHEDLAANYDASKEFTVNGVKQSPSTGSGVHGTAVSGIIAAAANGIGTVGVSSAAKLTGIDIFGNAGGSNMLAALGTMKNFDTVNHSWGWTEIFSDRGSTSFGSAFLAAMKSAADTGRGALGTIIVESAGNEWNDDRRSTNATEFGASRYSITVGAISQDGDVSYYSNRGASLLVSAPSNGSGAGITTTDRIGAEGYASGNYTSTFGGTSAAAPIVTGVTNLMLEASGNTLGWRDVQEILAITADHTTPTSLTGAPTGEMAFGWQINGADNVDGGGMHFSHDVGYGMVDAFEAVRLAEVWANFGAAKSSANEAKVSAAAAVTRAIPDNGATSFTVALSQNVVVEHVDLTLNFTHGDIKQLRVELVSPEGTNSILLSPMTGNAFAASGKYSFGSDALRGELSAGNWTVRVTDTAAGTTGSIADYKLDVYGSAVGVDDVYHYTDEFVSKMLPLSAARGVLSDADGGTDWIDMAALTGNVVAQLASGLSIAIDGVSRITLSGQIENIVTGDGNDLIAGNEVGNRILGMWGNDVLQGKGGADFLDGGVGLDTASYATSDVGVNVSLSGGVNTGGHAEGDILVNIENLKGSAFNDVLIGTTGDNVFTGGGGDDRVHGGAGDDTAVFTGRLSDYVVMRGSDMYGEYVTLTDTVSGRDGTDKLYKTENIVFSDQTALSAKLSTTYIATSGSDSFTGTANNDIFKVVGTPGGSDVFDGAAGTDVLDFSGLAAGSSVAVQLGNNAFTAAGVAGTALNFEYLVGSSGNDILYGNSLNNRIEGGGGNDSLRGGAGVDSFVFGANSGNDTIEDFTDGQDRMNFGRGADISHLTILASGNDLLVSDSDSFVRLIGQANLHLTNDDFLY